MRKVLLIFIQLEFSYRSHLIISTPSPQGLGIFLFHVVAEVNGFLQLFGCHTLPGARHFSEACTFSGRK